jgi:hypothetical protein
VYLFLESELAWESRLELVREYGEERGGGSCVGFGIVFNPILLEGEGVRVARDRFV